MQRGDITGAAPAFQCPGDEPGVEEVEMTGRSERAESAGHEAGDRAGEARRRQAVRESLLRFARDVAAAGSKAEVIDALTDVDGYVEELVERLEGDGG